jgi:replication fork clamp-binding protein CrfC
VVDGDFLARRVGIYTRGSLFLQVIHIEGDRQPKEWAEFLHDPFSKSSDFHKIRDQINAKIIPLCKTHKNITNKNVNLNFYSPNVLNLALVDLPGPTKIAVEDHPAGITPANQGLANSDSLIAGSGVDPAGNRTVEILTKVDLMDHGMDAREVFLNKVHSLKLAYLSVMNPSQQNIIGKKSLGAASHEEWQFFPKTPCSEDIAANSRTRFSTMTLNRLLMRDLSVCPDQQPA